MSFRLENRMICSQQYGLSLLELMITLLISTFLLLGVIQTFINSQTTYRLQESMSRMQEDGSLALEIIGRDLRATGYWGCLKGSTGDLLGTDATITLKAAFVTIPTGGCSSTVDKTMTYYLAKTSTIVYAIYGGVLRKNTNTQNNDLIEGVEAIQFLYGEDTNADHAVNDYVLANQVLNWEHVISVRVFILITSLEDNLTAQPVAYTFNTLTMLPTDHHLRRVFSATFALRNRLP
jgi:type IV pilus assembly protein PilW